MDCRHVIEGRLESLDGEKVRALCEYVSIGEDRVEMEIGELCYSYDGVVLDRNALLWCY